MSKRHTIPAKSVNADFGTLSRESGVYPGNQFGRRGESMTIKSKLMLVIAIVALLCVVGWTSRAEQSKPNWEYKAVTLWHNPDVVNPNLSQLNEIGDDGWELVAVIPSEVAGGNGHLHTRATCYFKRRIN
jgi:hypothetical protein